MHSFTWSWSHRHTTQITQTNLWSKGHSENETKFVPIADITIPTSNGWLMSRVRWKFMAGVL